MGLNIWNVKSQQLCSESGRVRGHQEGELLSHRRQSSARWGTKALASAISFSHPQPKSQREPVPITELACTMHTPNAVLLWIHPSDGLASLLVLQGPSCRGPLKAKRADPTPPATVYLVEPPQLIRQIPSKQHHKPGSVQLAQTGATPLHSEFCPWERGR